MILEIIQEVKADPSKNAKVAILTEHKDNELLQQALVACYSPYVQYYIRKIPDYTPRQEEAWMSLGSGIDCLEDLSERRVTGQAAKDHLVKVLEEVSADDAQIIVKIINKTMDAGFSGSTVNKVWKGLIPTYPCLLAKGCDEKTIKKMTFPAYSQLKADGMRINVHVADGKVSMCGRSGKALDILGELDEDMLELTANLGFCDPKVMFDGELILVEDDGSVMERKKGNGKLNKAIRGKMPADEAARVRIRVWDVISRTAFKAQKDETPYSTRFELVKNAVAKANTSKVELIETIEVADLPAAEKHFAEMLKRGEEGTLLKSKDHVWEDKRSYGLLKMKAIKDADLEVIDWQEGTGKYAGMLGALVCQSSDGKVEVSIGSGFSDAQRKTYTKANTVGQIVEILYNERISSRDRTDTDSLFLPRFVELREDKDVANSSAEIS